MSSSFCSVISRSFFLLFFFPLYSLLAGHGSSGGGFARTEHFKALGLRLLQLAETAKNQNETRWDDLLEGIDPADLRRAIDEVEIYFLSAGSAASSWEDKRFLWNGKELIDANLPGSPLIDAAYIDSEKIILVVETTWDSLNNLEKMLLARKEYWRVFNRPNAGAMRAHLVSLAMEAPERIQVEQEAENLSGPSESDEVMDYLAAFEGFYEIYYSDEPSQSKTVYLKVFAEQNAVGIYEDLAYYQFSSPSRDGRLSTVFDLTSFKNDPSKLRASNQIFHLEDTSPSAPLQSIELKLSEEGIKKIRLNRFQSQTSFSPWLTRVEAELRRERTTNLVQEILQKFSAFSLIVASRRLSTDGFCSSLGEKVTPYFCLKPPSTDRAYELKELDQLAVAKVKNFYEQVSTSPSSKARLDLISFYKKTTHRSNLRYLSCLEHLPYESCEIVSHFEALWSLVRG